MQEEALKRLQASHKFLVQNLQVDELVDFIYSKGIVTPEEFEDLENSKNSYKAARYLLRILPKKGPKAYGLFCEALVESEKQFVVDHLDAVDISTVVLSTTLFEEEDKMAQLQKQMCMQTELLSQYIKRDKDLERRLEESERRSEQKIQQLLEEKTKRYEDLDQLMQEKGISTQQARTYLTEYLSNQDVPDFAFAQGDNNTGSPLASPNKTASSVTPSQSFTFSLADVQENSLLECERISRSVGKDIVRYVVQRTMQKSGKIRAPSSAYAQAMRLVVDEILEKHDKLFTDFIVKLKMDEIAGYDTFVNVANEIFAEGDFNWGRVGVLFAFSGFVARFAAENGNERMATFMGDFIGFYVAKKLGTEINNLGGWRSFLERFAHEQLQDEPGDSGTGGWGRFIATAASIAAISALVGVAISKTN